MGEKITIVSGLPRSGTSAMMQMLVAAGMPALTDDQRQADEDNPRGYYEHASVLRLQQDASWLEEARGGVVKVVSPLLAYLPEAYEYNVIFMRRELDEIVASQTSMITHRQSEGAEITEEQLVKTYKNHLKDVYVWMGSQANVRSLTVHYLGLIENPLAVSEQVVEFLGNGLAADSMASAIDPSLYRNKAQ